MLLIASLWASPIGAEPLDSGIPLAVERAALAAEHLAMSETDNGSFVYEYDFLAGGASSNDNIIRQAGAGFALAEYLSHSGNLAFAERTARALQFYEQQSLQYQGGALVAPAGDPAGANPGATALAMLAELFYSEATGDTRFSAMRGQWLNGLKALWLPQGGFARRPGSDAASPYYDGEAWLALAHHQRLFPDHAEGAVLLERADRHFLVHYARAPDTGFLHWGLMAAAVRHQSTADARFSSYSALLAYIQLTRLRPRLSPNANACSMVEGLAATATVLEGVPIHSALLARIAARIEAELNKSLQFQILPEQTQINLGPGRFFFDDTLHRRAGAFLNGRFNLKTRIDYTQHCLSALMEYETWQKIRIAKSPPAGRIDPNAGENGGHKE